MISYHTIQCTADALHMSNPCMPHVPPMYYTCPTHVLHMSHPCITHVSLDLLWWLHAKNSLFLKDEFY